VNSIAALFMIGVLCVAAVLWIKKSDKTHQSDHSDKPLDYANLGNPRGDAGEGPHAGGRPPVDN
jgi:hypothetical protein